MDKLFSKKLRIYCNLSLLLAAFISGLSFVAQKLGMLYVGPFTFNVLRCFIGALSLLPVIFLTDVFFKYENRNQKDSFLYLIKGGILAGFVLFIAFSVNQYSLINASASKAGFITSLYILFVPILAIFLKQKLKFNIQLSIVLALIGLYLLCAKDTMKFESWDIFLLLSAFFFAVHILVVSCYSKKANVLKLSAIQFLTAGVLSLPFAMVFETSSAAAILAGWKPILFIGVVVTGVAYTLQIFGHKATKPVLATLILSTEAVFAASGGIIILNETLNIKETAGCIVMLIAIIVSQIQFKKNLLMKGKVYEISNQKSNI